MKGINRAAKDSGETQDIAGALAILCRAGDCIALHGDLGAGKTTFARGFIRALNPAEQDIVSPTFTIMQAYRSIEGTPISHFDLYRLGHAGEIAEIGLDDALQYGITLVEWPDIAIDAAALPMETLNVRIAMDEDGKRIITLEGMPSVWQTRLAKLEETS